MHQIKKMKVAIVENNLVIGGIQKLAVHQLQLLDRSRFDLSLITLTQSPHIGDFYDMVPADVPVHRLQFKNFGTFSQWVALWRVLKSIKPDLVKSSGYFSNVIVRILAIFLGYKVVTAEHNTNIERTFLQKMVSKILDPFTCTIVVDSQMVRDHLSKLDGISPDRYTVVYNAVDLEAIESSKKRYLPERNMLREELGITQNDVVFLSVARLVHQKNHELMLNAFAKAYEKRKSLILVIVGDGGLKGALKKQADDLGISSRVSFMGERKDVHRFNALSDFTWLTSRHEGFCIAAMEGLAFGAPLIATRVAGVSEYLKDGINGFFTSDDPEDIAETLVRCIDLTPEEYQVMKKEGEKTALEYGLDRYKDTFERMFARCVSK